MTTYNTPIESEICLLNQFSIVSLCGPNSYCHDVIAAGMFDGYECVVDINWTSPLPVNSSSVAPIGIGNGSTSSADSASAEFTSTALLIMCGLVGAGILTALLIAAVLVALNFTVHTAHKTLHGVCLEHVSFAPVASGRVCAPLLMSPASVSVAMGDESQWVLSAAAASLDGTGARAQSLFSQRILRAQPPANASHLYEYSVPLS